MVCNIQKDIVQRNNYLNYIYINNIILVWAKKSAQSCAL